ncbi:MAG: nuclear transport factor 2 family protein [Candidatus Izemoplasmatales bacterium]
MEPIKLTPEILKQEWAKTYRSDGKPDWSHIFPFYAPEIVFQDSIQKLSGMEKFTAMCNRLTKRCKSLEMEIISVASEEQLILMEWKMTMKFRFFPSSPIHGMSRLTLNEDGLITHQRDYYDLWGDIYDHVPIYKHIYRWFMRTFFG